MSDAPWCLDPDTWQLAGGPARTLTGHEWREQQWPPCPVCGSPIDVDRVEVTTYADQIGGVRKYIVGRWECPNECDPRRANPRAGQPADQTAAELDGTDVAATPFRMGER